MPYQFANGVHLRYETWGVGAEPLVLLHGLGSSADDWFLQLPAFAPHYLCVAVDLRGHGLSEKPAGRYTVGLFASDVAALLRLLDLAPAHILGLSLGGMVAQQLGSAHPQVARSLVLLNTLPGLWPPPRRMVRAALRRLTPPWRKPDMARAAGRVAADLFPDPAAEIFRAQAAARIAANDPAAYRRATMAVARFWPGPALGRIACPTLIVTGADDRVVPAVYQTRLRRALPHAQYVAIPGGGHACNIDRAAEVNAAVLEFLSHVRAG
jgi:pimeloyl-ACP methyl ester carboxylesterase